MVRCGHTLAMEAAQVWPASLLFFVLILDISDATAS